jgi:arylsulfatase A-like enzyme
VSLDTLRADRLEAYGYDRPTSPNLEAFGRRAVVFEAARAQASQTAPSHASLFTSEYPGAHRIVNVHGANPKVHLLPPGVETLAEVLSGAGIETAAFVSGGNLTRKMHMDRGFDVWDEQLEDVSERINALLRWAMAPERGRFFAVLHTYQVHAPYLPPRDVFPEFVDPAYDGPLRARLERFLDLPAQDSWAAAAGPEYWAGMLEFAAPDVQFLSDLYDAEVRYLDREIRRLLEYLLGDDQLGAQTAIIVLSDHGEEFMDHGKYQHDQVFEELVHVPLMVRMPPSFEEEGYVGRVATPVELIDVAPTVVELLGVSPGDAGWSGRSLLPVMRRPGAGLPPGWDVRPTFSELVVDPGPKYYRAVSHLGWKYIHAWQQNIDATWEWLFHLEEDPGEAVNLLSSQDPEVQRILARLRALLEARTLENAQRAQEVGSGGAVEMDADMERLMRQLGYIK